jgi:four helix bundle protein
VTFWTSRDTYRERTAERQKARKEIQILFILNIKVMENNYHSFEDLLIWQEGMNLCDEIYTVLKRCKDYSLRDQMQRSAVSMPSNIAERFELSTNRAFIRHLYISKGSAGELRTQIYIAIKQGYIDQVKGSELVDLTKKLSAMISKFISARKGKIRKPGK